MSWYRRASRTFMIDFDDVRIGEPPCSCFGDARVEFNIRRDRGSSRMPYEPPTVDIEVQPEVENITCVDVDDNLIKVTPDMISQVEYSLKHGSESARVRERALDHEWS